MLTWVVRPHLGGPQVGGCLGAFSPYLPYKHCVLLPFPLVTTENFQKRIVFFQHIKLNFFVAPLDLNCLGSWSGCRFYFSLLGTFKDKLPLVFFRIKMFYVLLQNGQISQNNFVFRHVYYPLLIPENVSKFKELFCFVCLLFTYQAKLFSFQSNNQ